MCADVVTGAPSFGIAALCCCARMRHAAMFVFVQARYDIPWLRLSIRSDSVGE